MFTTYLDAHKIFEDARLLTYGQFILKFVYIKKSRTWKPKKRGYTIG